jgi:hypothetical protein
MVDIDLLFEHRNIQNMKDICEDCKLSNIIAFLIENYEDQLHMKYFYFTERFIYELFAIILIVMSYFDLNLDWREDLDKDEKEKIKLLIEGIIHKLNILLSTSVNKTLNEDNAFNIIMNLIYDLRLLCSYFESLNLEDEKIDDFILEGISSFPYLDLWGKKEAEKYIKLLNIALQNR